MAFSHQFEIDDLTCIVIQYGEKFELRIDNQSFNHLYDLQKSKVAYQGGVTSKVIIKPENSEKQKHSLGFNISTGKYYADT